MKHLLILTAIVFLSCKEKETEKTIVEIAAEVTEVAAISGKNLPDKIVNNSEGYKDRDETTVQNSSYLKSYLYKGALNGNIKISLYLTAHENPCGGGMDAPSYNAMYKYDNQEKWMLLNVNTDLYRTQFCMVEDWFTGTLFLTKNGYMLNGKWISPDTKKQFYVELEDQLLDNTLEFDKAVIQNLDVILFDDLLFYKNDC